MAPFDSNVFARIAAPVLNSLKLHGSTNLFSQFDKSALARITSLNVSLPTLEVSFLRHISLDIAASGSLTVKDLTLVADIRGSGPVNTTPYYPKLRKLIKLHGNIEIGFLLYLNAHNANSIPAVLVLEELEFRSSQPKI
ncbi:hypothetical protein M422DRAFT_247469 [Sphaerobolus stellatus SS14]|nr:hypothetical protein M422DRAFT_247469 [Sphaerobolus stellatus SS14]